LPRSMTAFAQGEFKDASGTLRCELRAVNHRYLDISLQLPESLKPMEHALREILRAGMQRGKVTFSMGFEAEKSASGLLTVDQDLAQAYIHSAQQIADQIKAPAPINPMDILRFPGVLQSSQELPEDIDAKALQLIESVLQTFLENREREGAALAEVMLERVKAIAVQVDLVEAAVPEIRAALEQKMRKKLGDLDIEANAERLEQELVIQAQRLDVDEEIDRLRTHLSEIELQLSVDEPVGRRLDFLAQELNREANTLASKSQGIATSQGAIEIKVCIEQIREQIQNIE
jgi:uncharacterized protein (TIGR00255 family)